MAKWPALIKLDTAPSTHIESCEVMSPILHRLKQAPKMGEPAGSTTSESESETDLVSECIFLVTAPWTHSADPPHLGPIHSLFQCLSTHRDPAAQPLHVRRPPSEAPSQVLLSCM